MANFKLSVVFSLVSLAYHVAGQSSANYLVCKPVESLFVTNSSSSDANGSKVGPRGPPGLPGKRGPPGPAVDPELVMKSVAGSLEARRCGGFSDGGFCYRLLSTSALTTANQGGKQRAADLCAFHRGSLVDIDSQKLYRKIYDHVKNTWMGWLDDPTRNYVEVWLASSFQNNVVVSSAGGAAYVDWYPGYPQGSGDGLALLIRTHPDRSASNVGVWNPQVTHNRPMAFCRFTQRNDD